MPDTSASSRGIDMALCARSPGRAGLRSEFAAFYEEAYPRLVSQVRVITGGPTSAPAAVQRAMSRAWIRWSRLRRLDDPQGW